MDTETCQEAGQARTGGYKRGYASKGIILDEEYGVGRHISTCSQTYTYIHINRT